MAATELRSLVNRFWLRRLAYGMVTLFMVACVLRIDGHLSESLLHHSFVSGYLLTGAVLFLSSFNLRKRLNFLPAGSATAWLQMHVYSGLGAIVLFLVHVGYRIPNGNLERALAWLFLATSLSGLIGLYWTRTIPAKLSKLRDQAVFERIPVLRRRVQQRAHQTMLELLRESPAEAFREWYSTRLVYYFVRPRGWLYYLAPSSGLRNELHRELAALNRYLSEAERAATRDMQRMIDRRDDLDYQDAQQRWLKCWLFVHVSLTAMLLVVMFVHVVMAHAFSGWS